MNQHNQQIWAQVLSGLTDRVKPELISEWLADLQLVEYGPQTVSVVAPSALHAKTVRDHYSEYLAEGFEALTGSRPRVSVEASSGGDVPPAVSTAAGTARRSAYNPSFTLASFVEGSPNRLALAASRAIVDRPGDLYNPLFVHGMSGTGKTHLLQAVCHELSSTHQVLYLTADEFSSRIASNRAESADFRHALRSAQLLALDDVQTLEGREASQEELFHAFNSLYNRNGQLLFAADRPPRKLEHLPERLTSRFTWGLTVEIEPPLFENRLEILASKSAAKNMKVPAEVLEELAAPKISNVRELEGLLARLMARLQIQEDPPDRELARELVSTAVADTRPELSLSSEDIQRVVAAAYGLKPHDLLGPSRTRSVAIARHVAVYLARQLTNLPIQEIGGHFGGRDHSTINYAINKIERLIKKDNQLAKRVQKLRQQLGGKRVSS